MQQGLVVSEELFEGFRCLALESGTSKLWVTLDVGPRILGLSHAGSENLFFVKPETRGLLGGEEYRGYGGHRLWTAPEIVSRTYEPENSPVTVEQGSRGSWSFTPSLGASLLGKRLTIAPTDQGWAIGHEVTNYAPVEQTAAAWAVSVMAAGGRCLAPSPIGNPAPNSKVASGLLAVWPYTRLDDPRLHVGTELLAVQQTDQPQANKIGAWIDPGVAAYVRDGHAFVKRFGAGAGVYPDFGCNFQIYTRHDMLEVESLGPLVKLAQGESLNWTEHWNLHADPGFASDAEWRAWLLHLAA